MKPLPSNQRAFHLYTVATTLSLFLALQVPCVAASSPKILSREPAKGELTFGTKVLVDDGTCPPGQIKQISRQSEDTGRQKKCVAWKGKTAVKILKKEPGKGQVPGGAKILVDDGTCGAGKIKEVTGGFGSQGRKRKCIAR
jgi:hypothetical protein